MSEESAAQQYFDPPDDDDIRCPHGKFFSGAGSCPQCANTDLEEEPPDLEDYMMRKRGLIE